MADYLYHVKHVCAKDGPGMVWGSFKDGSEMIRRVKTVDRLYYGSYSIINNMWTKPYTWIGGAAGLLFHLDGIPTGLYSFEDENGKEFLLPSAWNRNLQLRGDGRIFIRAYKRSF